MKSKFLPLGVVVLLAACATYVPPRPGSPESYSRDLDASYGDTWSAVTYVAGESFFNIKNFEKASGLMTLAFDLKDVNPYVDCGTAVNHATNTTEPALQALLLSGVSLSGTANINIREESRNRTAIQFNAQYTLTGYRIGPDGNPAPVVQWQFTSGNDDTETVSEVGIPVTCRSSYKIEQDFLTEVSARI
jgi:hypothetical protein